MDEIQQYSIDEIENNNVILRFIDFCDFDENRYKESLNDLILSANHVIFDLSKTKFVAGRWFRLFESFDQKKVGFILSNPVEYMREFRKINLRCNMSVNGIMKAVASKSLSPDSIRSMAYMLAKRTGHRSDEIASMFGRQLHKGIISEEEAEWLFDQSENLILLVWDEVEPFVEKI